MSLAVVFLINYMCVVISQSSGINTENFKGYATDNQDSMYVEPNKDKDLNLVNNQMVSTADSIILDTDNLDITPPTQPQLLKVMERTDNHVVLAWEASTDDVGVKEYNIYQGSTLVGTTTDTTYTVNGLSEGKLYKFRVTAKDNAGNTSPKTDSLSVATLGVNGEMLYNPSFSQDTSGWYFYSSSDTQVNKGRDTETYDSSPASYKVEVMKSAGSTASIQFQSAIPMNIVQDHEYKLTFRAKAAQETKISRVALLQGGSPWTKYAPEINKIPITTEWATYTVDFKANSTVSDATIIIYLGTVPDGTIINFDSLSLMDMGEGDKQAPTAPANLTFTDRSSSSISLTWNSSSDDVGVKEYNIYQGSTLVGTTTDTSYTVANLSEGALFSFTVAAKDQAGNTSSKSNALSVATLGPDGQMLYNPSFSQNEAGWYFFGDSTVQATKGRDTEVYDSAPASYKVDISKSGGTFASIQLQSTIRMNIISNHLYKLSFRARASTPITLPNVSLMQGNSPWAIYSDEKWNIPITTEWQTLTLSFKAAATANDAIMIFYMGKVPDGTVINLDSLSLVDMGEDKQAPTTPANLKLSDRSSTSISLTWNPSSDDVGVREYNIYQGSTLVGTTTDTTYTVTNLSEGALFSFTVAAKDYAGNTSSKSNALSVATLGPDGQMLHNPSFSQKEAGWYLYSSSAVQVNKGRDTEVYDSAPASFKVDIIKSAGTVASVQLQSTIGMNIINNHQYRLTFRAKASSDTKISRIALMQGSSPWAKYAPEIYNFPITSEWGTHTVDFIANSTVSDATIVIYLGTVPDGTIINIDSLSLVDMGEGDKQAPTAPTNLKLSDRSSTSISLTWNPSSDDVGVKEYNIYQGSTLVGTTTDTSYTVTNLSEGALFSFTVAAKDQAGNTSSKSNALSVATLGLNGEMLYNPSFSQNESGWYFFGDSTVQATKGRATDVYDSAPASYKVDISKSGGTFASIQLQSTIRMNIISNHLYELTFRAKASTPITLPNVSLKQGNSPWTIYSDEEWNIPITADWQTKTLTFKANATASDAVIIFYMGKVPDGTVIHFDSLSLVDMGEEDKQSPTPPTNVALTNISSASINLAWDPSIDNHPKGVKDYIIYRDGVEIGTVPVTSFEDINLLPEKEYNYYVVARDYSGNISEPSESITVTTLKPSLGVPQNLTGTVSSGVIILSWEKVIEATGYELMVNDQIISIGDVSSYTFENAEPFMSYLFKVRAISPDRASEWSNEAIVTVVPKGVQNIVSSVTTREIILSWDATLNADYYEIEVDGQVISLGNSTSFKQTEIQPETVYSYRVRASKESVIGEWSDFYYVSTLTNRTIISSNMTLSHDLTYYNLYIQGGVIDLNGFNLVVEGNLILSDGEIIINNGSLIVNGDFRIQTEVANEDGSIGYSDSTGILRMENDNDYVLINGDFITQTSSFRTEIYYYNLPYTINSGTIEIKGDFLQKSSDKYNSTFCSGLNSRILISGRNAQTICFDNEVDSRIAVLEIANTSNEGVTFESAVIVTTELKQTSSALVNSKNISIHNAVMPEHWNYDISTYYFPINKDTIIEGDLYVKEETDYLGGCLIIPNNIMLEVRGNLYEQKSKKLSDDSYIENGGKLIVHKNFYMCGVLYNKELGYTKIGENLQISNDLINHGNIEIDGSVFVNENYVPYYNGTLLNISEIINHGVINIEGDLDVNAYIWDRSEINIGGNVYLHYDAYIWSNKSININGNVIHDGGYFYNTNTTIRGNYYLNQGECHVFSYGSSSIEKDLVIKDGNIFMHLGDDGGLLEVYGNVIQDGGRINCYKELNINGNYYFNKGICTVYTTLTASNINQADGKLYLFDGNLIVGNDYKIQSRTMLEDGTIIYGDCYGLLGMTNGSYILVNGDFYTQSNINHNEYRDDVFTYGTLLLGGTFEIKGDFTQLQGTTEDSKYNFSPYPYLEHTVLLSGENQKITFANPEYSRFHILAITSPIDSYNFNYKPVWNYLIQLDRASVHNGTDGVYGPTGNYSKNFTDMTSTVPGFTITLSRTYNSQDTEEGILGKGWNQGFESKITDAGAKKRIKLPNGSSLTFILQSDGSYTGDGNSSILTREADGSYILITQDQYTYGFSSSRYLAWMKDRNGNTIQIKYDSNNKIKSVEDQFNNVYTYSYNSDGLLSSISDPLDRVVLYLYENKRLVKVTDPNGISIHYGYDDEGNLNRIIDNSGFVKEEIQYYNGGEKIPSLVNSIKDEYGNIRKFEYSNTEQKTTIIDSSGRKTEQYFDDSYCIIKTIDSEGKETLTEYFKDSNGLNVNMQIKSTTDRNGNKIQYERDSRGNITKIINPDGSFKLMTYDEKNNLISERDEDGKYTFYAYDENSVNLLKKVQPLNGTDTYSSGSDESRFAITHYSYYEQGESGYTSNGLLKSVTDPEGNTVVYTYDSYGNIQTVSDPETGAVTTYEYNVLGWKTAEISPKGYRTEYVHDKNGNIVKIVADSTSQSPTITRTVYDGLGRKVQEIHPNQYDASMDNFNVESGINSYLDVDAGYRYTYYDNGTVKSITDPEQNTTSYTYDLYGNVLTEAKPNGSIYVYEYDVMNRITKKLFKEDSSAAPQILEEYSYSILDDKTTKIQATQYFSDTETAVTSTIRDYAGREIRKTNPNGTSVITEYNANGTVASVINVNGYSTYYKYDGLNRLVEQWTPFSLEGSVVKYSYQKISYDKSGRQKQVLLGKQLVSLYALPTSYRATTYDYYKNGKIKAIYVDGQKREEYCYDDDGYITQEKKYKNAVAANITEYENNYLGKPVLKTQYVTKGDLYGNTFSDDVEIALSTHYAYDRNGNLVMLQTPDQDITTYEYDNLNRQTKLIQQGINEYGARISFSFITTYNWEGKPLSTTDARGSTTLYNYDERGNLVKIIDALGGITAFEYDRAGRKILEVAPANYELGKTLKEMNRVSYFYDSMSRLITKTFIGTLINLDESQAHWIDEPVSIVQEAYQYDSSGNVIKRLDGMGYEAGSGDIYGKINTGYGTLYTYNLANLQIMICDPVNSERGVDFLTRYEYDAFGRKVSETNANGAVTLYSYDGDGNIIKVEVKKDSNAPSQMLKQATYDYLGNTLSLTDGNGKTTYYEYNELGKVRKMVSPSDDTIPENTVIYQYDLMGQQVFQKDSMGHVVIFSYDNQGRVISQTLQDEAGAQAIETFTRYDVNGNKRFVVDGNGNTTEYRYDELNQLTETQITVTGIVQTMHYTYDKNGNQTGITDWLGNTSTMVYDAMNRVIEKRDPYGNSIQKLQYNLSNAQIKSFDANNNVTEFTYDKNGKLLATIDSCGDITNQEYDSVGNTITKIDGNSQKTVYKYDEMNRLIAVINAKGEETSYTYDLNGNMLSQTDGRGNTQNYEYNAANKLIRRIDAGGRTGTSDNYSYNLGKTETYTYYADGSLKSKVDRNGETTHYIYDCFGRLADQFVGDIHQSYTYDANGNMLTMTDSTGVTTRTYDELNQVITKSAPHFGTSTFEYDITLGLDEGYYAEKTTDPKGNIVTKTYDKLGRLVQVSSNGDTVTYEYYNNGNRKSVIYGSGLIEDYTYYQNNLLKTLTNKKSDGTVIDSYSYTYDNARNMITKIDNKGTTTYSYDELNRLETVVEPSGRTITYTYDESGNRKTETITIGNEITVNSFLYNEQNRLLSITSTVDGTQTVSKSYTYDNNGNQLVTYIDGNSSLNNTYNELNQLIMTQKDENTLTYQYNAEGYRVEKRTNGNITRYLYEADKVVLEADASGGQIGYNIYGLNLLKRTVDGETYNYLYNGHGDVTALVSEDGHIVNTYYYDAFGNILEQTGTIDNSITYAGYQYDDETGLYYLNSRYYDSLTARFLSEDTYRGQLNDPLSLNLYTYCENNPIRYIDPDGHAVTEWDKKNIRDPNHIKQLELLTKQWEAENKNKNKNTQLLDSIHKQAEAIRQQYRDSNEVGTGEGYTYKKIAGNDQITKYQLNEYDLKYSNPVKKPDTVIFAVKGTNEISSKQKVQDKKNLARIETIAINDYAEKLTASLTGLAKESRNVLDLLGTVDGSGLSDILSGLLSLSLGDKTSAFLSLASVLPLGDLLKSGKLSKVDDIADTISDGAKTAKKGASKTVRETLLDSVSNQKLKNAINEIYRPGAKIGDGGLADAIRHELKTGELVGGKSHIIKGTERVKNLENIIKTQNLNQSDLNNAQKLLNDLKNALGGK